MYIARQPIFDRSKKVYGYELLYRMHEHDLTYGEANAQQSTATVLGGLFELGLSSIVNGRKAFINFDYSFLMSDAIELISPDSLVIEVLETVEVDQPLVERIWELKKKGYSIALDDFEETVDGYPLIPAADIIKYDILLTPLHLIIDEVKKALKQKKYLLAEKIETEEEFEKAYQMGFHFFQGFFFSKPKVVGGIKGKKTAKVVYQNILNELHKEEPSFQIVAEIIETDAALAYRVMALSGKEKHNTKTIKATLTKMGLLEVERWIRLMMMQEMATDKPQELFRISLIRSKFGEAIADHSGRKNRKYEISLMCLFSVIDGMLDMPMEDALAEIKLEDDIRDALIFHVGPMEPILKLIECYERGDCEHIIENADMFSISPDKLKDWYLQSIQWADKVMNYYHL